MAYCSTWIVGWAAEVDLLAPTAQPNILRRNTSRNMVLAPPTTSGLISHRVLSGVHPFTENCNSARGCRSRDDRDITTLSMVRTLSSSCTVPIIRNHLHRDSRPCIGKHTQTPTITDSPRPMRGPLHVPVRLRAEFGIYPRDGVAR